MPAWMLLQPAEISSLDFSNLVCTFHLVGPQKLDRAWSQTSGPVGHRSPLRCRTSWYLQIGCGRVGQLDMPKKGAWYKAGDAAINSRHTAQNCVDLGCTLVDMGQQDATGLECRQENCTAGVRKSGQKREACFVTLQLDNSSIINFGCGLRRHSNRLSQRANHIRIPFPILVVDLIRKVMCARYVVRRCRTL